jgi:hypothetical protein
MTKVTLEAKNNKKNHNLIVGNFLEKITILMLHNIIIFNKNIYIKIMFIIDC